MTAWPWLAPLIVACAAFITPEVRAENVVRLAPSLQQQTKIKSKARTAEVLNTITQTSLLDDGHWRSQHYVSIRLNDVDAARDYGRITIPFNHYYSDMTLHFANVLARDGRLSPVADDAVQLRVTGGGQDFYSDSSEYVFSLPDIAAGSIIEFQYAIESKQLALPGLFADRSTPYWFQRKVGGEGWRTDFVHHHRLQISAPTDNMLHYKTYNSYPKEPTLIRHQDLTEYTWTATGVAPITLEPNMPPLHKVAPQVFISTSDNWAIVDKWAWENSRDKFAASDRLRAIAAELEQIPRPTTEAKARAVYEYLQRNYRYVFAHLGRGGYEPHFADDVISASYGDCKDQTILAVALLRLMGVNAYPALVETPRSGDHDTELVSLIFDHMIVYIPPSESNNEIWMDTTRDSSLYPGVSNYLLDQNALIVDGDGGKLTRINSGFEANHAELTLNYRPLENGRTRVHADIVTSGYIEQNIRSWWIHENNRESELDKLLRSIFAPDAEYDYNGAIHNTDDLWQPVSLSATFTFPQQENNTEPTVYGANFNQLFQLFGHLRNLHVPHTRKNDFTDKYTFTLQLNAIFNEPEGTIAAVMQSGGNITTPFVELMQSGEATEQAYKVTFQFRKNPVNTSAEEYEQYYSAVENAATKQGWLVSMQPDQRTKADYALAAVKKTSGKKSMAYLLAKARHEIDNADFENALMSAKKAVAVDQQNGEAWYLLGMAQGFNAMIIDSSNSFEKAETLGYLP